VLADDVTRDEFFLILQLLFYINFLLYNVHLRLVRDDYRRRAKREQTLRDDTLGTECA